jgi:D-alanyl-D-alanine carboxypeptidase/D-alanyl-D-alanine-endopeptidase (penicillin-binding protein 4)
MRRFLAPVLLLILSAALGFGALQAGADNVEPGPAGEVTHPVTPVLSGRRVPLFLAAPVADRNLAAGMADIVARSPGQTCLVVTYGGRTLFEQKADTPVVPASTEKLVTATAALEVLGPETRFRTTVVATAPPSGGVVEGDVWVVGGGDPLLATDPYIAHFENQPQIATRLEGLADALVKAGITRISGRILGDDSRYDAERYLPAWPVRFQDQNQTGPLSALSVNDNYADYPAKQSPLAPEEIPAEDPPAFGAGTLAVLLKERNVLISGGAAGAKAPDGAVELAAVESPPLRDIVRQMLSESDNQTAELLVKEMGRLRTGQGTTAAGVPVVNQTMQQLGFAAEGVTVTDGSGLDAANKISCRLLGGVLDRAGSESAIALALPIAGETGTLAKRFLDSPARGRLHGKTGTLNDVTALAGFVDTTQGPTLTFAYVANGRSPSTAFVKLQEEMAAVLIRYPEGPPLEQLIPKAVG